MPTIKAILFDMDGTLLDTESLSDKALLLAFGKSIPENVMATLPMKSHLLPWELKKQILGLRGAEWAPIALKFAKDHWGVTEERNPPNANTLWKNWEDELNSMSEEVETCAGANELVEALSKTGLPLAIATSSRYMGVEKKKKRHSKIFQYMNDIVAGDDPAVKMGKPAPDIYLEAARRLNVDPGECLVFEDALSGVRSGKAAGCFVVAIPDKRFSAEEKASFSKEADVVLENLFQFDGTQFGLDINIGRRNPKSS